MMDCQPTYTLWAFAEDMFAAVGLVATFAVMAMSVRAAVAAMFDRFAE